jgi:mRNA-degrading endonuclease toxin of MazEF toxin-antitoxin module
VKIKGPEPGLVIRYDFLWKQEVDRGQEYGVKERPCAIVLTSEPRNDGSRQVVVCPITHTPPDDAASAIEIPSRVSAHLKLDSQKSWIRTHEVNSFNWEEGRIPVGIVPADKDRDVFGFMPPKLYAQMRDQILALRRRRAVSIVRRDKDDPE